MGVPNKRAAHRGRRETASLRVRCLSSLCRADERGAAALCGTTSLRATFLSSTGAWAQRGPDGRQGGPVLAGRLSRRCEWDV
ncbi:hypothetical protein GN956_G9945 [Arapaima gigas]